jgi:hypothetical protein|tara:strand:- start:63 stop:227 length:165 start_codon:yes stop_codon:yes gene_type:complete
LIDNVVELLKENGFEGLADAVGVRLFSSGGCAQLHALEAWNIAPSNLFSVFRSS